MSLDNLTKQEAYEKIRAWFSRPNAVYGMDPQEANCVYRAEQDPHSEIRCAVGCLIPDDIYDPAWEGQTIFLLSGNGRLSTPARELGLREDVVQWLETVQVLHDRCANEDFQMRHFLSELDIFAREADLQVVA